VAFVELIGKRGAKPASAIFATPATTGSRESDGPVAGVATVAVARECRARGTYVESMVSSEN
jgi:hypothetical protein